MVTLVRSQAASLSSASFAVLSANFVAFGDDFFNAEAARVGAEVRGEHVASATLCENLCGLGVEAGGPTVWLRLGRAMSLRFSWRFQLHSHGVRR